MTQSLRSVSAKRWGLTYRRLIVEKLTIVRGLQIGISTLATAVMLTGCGSLSSPNSPDVIYDRNAVEAKDLQVPPDLTDVSSAEQFVLPGTASDVAVKRNTLLPQFSSVRFVREGAQSWLAFAQSPEDLWPQLLAFARDQGYRIDQTEPVAGIIVSQWRDARAFAKANRLQNLVGNNEQFTRVAFRLERDGNAARLFARSQAASQQAAAAPNASQFSWPVSSHDPENTSRLLAGFLVFLGLEEQKAKGILSEQAARAVVDDAIIQTNATGNQLLIHHGFQSSFERVVGALEGLQYSVLSTDDGVGRIEFATDAESTVSPLIITLAPQHVSAVTLSLTDAKGQRLDSTRELDVLRSLLAQLA